MQPLVLREIADCVGLSESTISRITSRKYMCTPRGTFELKHFFSSHAGAASGCLTSSTAIRAIVRMLIAEEDPSCPHSDEKLRLVLKQRGIAVSRRAIAKYREAMNIPKSYQRGKST